MAKTKCQLIIEGLQCQKNNKFNLLKLLRDHLSIDDFRVEQCSIIIRNLKNVSDVPSISLQQQSQISLPTFFISTYDYMDAFRQQIRKKGKIVVKHPSTPNPTKRASENSPLIIHATHATTHGRNFFIVLREFRHNGFSCRHQR